ncbi:MAG: winged helix-turn-helix domain-containing protein [Calditrichia bacterium]
MSMNTDNPYAGLKRIFHEPKRLAIMSVLCSTIDGVTFNQLKEECNLTDGNLSSHLKMLEEAAVVKIEKSFIGSKPQTRVFITDTGRDNFVDYLKALEEVLMRAAEAVSSEEKKVYSFQPGLKPAGA